MPDDQLDLWGEKHPIVSKKPKAVQQPLFAANDSEDWGASARPTSDDQVKLALVSEDPRTEEERDADRLAAARRATTPLERENLHNGVENEP